MVTSCPTIQSHRPSHSKVTSRSPHAHEAGQADGRASSWLPLKGKAVMTWGLGPSSKATNPVTGGNHVLIGPQFPHLTHGANNTPPLPHTVRRPRPGGREGTGGGIT